ncbi:MAG: DUF1353 domain-containing protein [Planctomycetota bacterium]
MNGPSLELLPEPDSRGRPRFRLLSPYQYRLGPGSAITVPPGYVTNFGTIPRWFAWWISPGELREAAIIHDWMCNEDLTGTNHVMVSGYSRWLADAVLYEAMARLGFSWPKRALVFAAVRIYAIITYRKKWPQRPEELKVCD